VNVVAVSRITKSFNATRAVDELSFKVHGGEIFAMLGPNGAGKTTTIRMALDIIKPDSGAINVLGGPLTQATKERIGYLPEERGLYRSITVLDCLTYLGSLKGMDSKVAKKRASELLERMELGPNKQQKVSELSRGMQQKAQFAATILHDPDLVIIDEPFSGLDPVNTRLIKDMIYELKARNKTVIMSTHMMHQVEEMADRLLMMYKGRRVLYGPVNQVREQFALNAVFIDGQGDWSALPGVARVQMDDKETELILREGVTSDDLLAQLAGDPSYKVTRFEVAVPSLTDIFITVVGKDPNRTEMNQVPEPAGVSHTE
jgi:ABC-2 type transport system ATP-binding protein